VSYYELPIVIGTAIYICLVIKLYCTDQKGYLFQKLLNNICISYRLLVADILLQNK